MRAAHGLLLLLLLSSLAANGRIEEWNKRPLREPTEPRPVEKFFPGWAPAQALILSAPLDIMRKHEDRRNYIADVIRPVIPHLDVYILYDEEKEGDLYFFENFLKNDPAIGEHCSERLHFVRSRAQSEWIRDFGPFFGRGQAGELLVFDQGYQGLEYLKTLWDLEYQDLFFGGDNQREMERSQLINFLDDITPNFIVTFLKRRYLRHVELVRPPLTIAGGDFATDGEGRFFITEDTLMENGGSKAKLLELFEKYYGATELHILFANPGRTTRHLDMSLKLVNPNLALLVEPSLEQPTTTRQQRRLLQEMRETSEANRAYLEKHLPHVSILSLPMPPLIFANRESIEREIQEEVMTEAGRQAGLDMDRINTAGPESSLYREAAAIIRNRLRRDLNWDPALGSFDLAAAVARYLDADLEDKIQAHMESRVLFRTYANSVHIPLEGRSDLVLIPSYDLRKEENAAAFEDLEERVLAVYAQAYPDAELILVNSDPVIKWMGAVHCTTLVLPRW